MHVSAKTTLNGRSKEVFLTLETGFVEGIFKAGKQLLWGRGKRKNVFFEALAKKKKIVL